MFVCVRWAYIYISDRNACTRHGDVFHENVFPIAHVFVHIYVYVYVKVHAYVTARERVCARLCVHEGSYLCTYSCSCMVLYNILCVKCKYILVARR